MLKNSALEKLAKTFDRNSIPQFTAVERRTATIMIVDSDATVRASLRQTLIALGFGGISDATDHVLALQKLEQRKFSHVIFEAKKTNMPSRDFLIAALELDDSLVGIPSSYEPTIDDVFDLLVVGARGYVVKPFTEAGLEDAMLMATKGDPISDAILFARNRNEALASLILTSLDRLATTMRQAQQFETARHELPRLRMALRRAIDIGRTFAKGGEIMLLQAIAEMCIDRGDGPASKLGRVRKRLPFKKRRQAKDESGEPAPGIVPETIEGA